MNEVAIGSIDWNKMCEMLTNLCIFSSTFPFLIVKIDFYDYFVSSCSTLLHFLSLLLHLSLAHILGGILFFNLLCTLSINIISF